MLTDELLASLPAEPDDRAATGFFVDSATVMLIRKQFVSARLTDDGITIHIKIEMEHQSLSVFTFPEGPPYAPQTIELG